MGIDKLEIGDIIPQKGLFMGLIKNLIAKLRKPKEFIFENFRENFANNQKFLQMEFKKMQKGFNVIATRKEIDFYMPNVLDEIDEFILDMMEQTNSESFSFNFAHIVTCARMYAANYMGTDEGKTYREVKFACERLASMVDCLHFNYLAHINCETNMEAEYIDGVFRVDKNCYASRLIEMINRVNENILNIAEGIYNKNRTPVLKGFNNLSNKEMYRFNKSSIQFFGL